MPRRYRGLHPTPQSPSLLLLHLLRTRQGHGPVLRPSNHEKDKRNPHLHRLRHPKTDILEQTSPIRGRREADPMLRLPATAATVRRMGVEVGGSGDPAAIGRRQDLLRAVSRVQTQVRDTEILFWTLYRLNLLLMAEICIQSTIPNDATTVRGNSEDSRGSGVRLLLAKGWGVSRDQGKMC